MKSPGNVAEIDREGVHRPMESSASEQLMRRLNELERLVKELRARVQELERQLAMRPEHPVDQAAVVEPVRYDWQQ